MATQTVAKQLFEELRSALSTNFPVAKVDEVLTYYEALRKDFRLDRYDSCLVNGGKFTEAVLKCLHFLRTGNVVDSLGTGGAGEEIVQLGKATSTTVLNDIVRVIIPRILRVIYDFRNKRGGAHNSSFDPIKMDCALVIATANWVMEELTRLYLTNDEAAARVLVESLLVKDISLVEVIGEDRLILNTGLSARIQLEVLLYREYPIRCHIKELIHWVHNHSPENIRVTMRAMKQKNFVHETEEGWLLTENGIREAEMEISKLENDTAGISIINKGKSKGAKRGRK